MGRGRRDVSKTRNVLLKILSGMLYKQIAFEEGVHLRSIAWIKGKYIDETVTFRLNALGLRLLNEEQLSLPLHRVSILRVDHRLRDSSRPSNRRQRPRKLV